ncbi:hypothetical protein FBU31_001379 [Coemansia sp. 'formosensis']|nr:hypothetical protein FBU31_001379 [Coemansia sp. 'formosensis']
MVSAYYAQRDCVYCASNIDNLVREVNLSSAGLELVLNPISLVTISESAAPSPHEKNCDLARLLVYYDRDSLVVARGFQQDMLNRHPELRKLHVETALENIVKYGITSRDLPMSKAIMDYFMAEVEPRIRAILLVSKPHAQFWVINGLEGDRADIFLMIIVPNQAGQRVCCSVAVMFTMPYHFEADRDNKLAVEARPDWVVDSELPSEAYGHKILQRIYDYLGNNTTMGPPAVRGTVNHYVAIWSSYNDTWVVRSKESRDSTSTLSTSASVLGADVKLTISTRFACTNADPHIAFVYVEVLDELIMCMHNSTEGYPLMPEM